MTMLMNPCEGKDKKELLEIIALIRETHSLLIADRELLRKEIAGLEKTIEDYKRVGDWGLS